MLMTLITAIEKNNAEKTSMLQLSNKNQHKARSVFSFLTFFQCLLVHSIKQSDGN